MEKIGLLGEGGQGLSQGHEGSGSTMKKLFSAVRDELDDMRTKYASLLAKMDTDFTDQNGAVTGSQLDTDYASSQALESPTFEK